MHMQLAPSSFFELSEYEHASLFEGCDFVWQALKRIKSYLAAHSLGKIQIDLPNNVYLVNAEQISIGEGSIVEPGAFIQGPCVIGKNCVVRHAAYIRGSLITGNNCVIGHTTEVKNAIFLNEVRADHFAYIGDSILGNRAHLGAGVKCANLKLDNSFIKIQVQDMQFNTEMHKLGAILGDDVQIGCNSVTNPGTLLGKGSFCYPAISINGFIEPQSIVKSNQKMIISSKSAVKT